MTSRVWELAKNLTLNVEGEYQCDPDDKGNWTGGNVGAGLLKGTKYGISAASFPTIDIKNLTKDQAIYLYKTRYWGKYRCDYMPDALSIAVFDYVFLSGQKGAEDLQKVLGVKIDGIIGNQTIGACNSQPLRKIIEEYFKLRMEYIKYLGSKPKYKKYEKGWINRVNHIKRVCEELC